MKLPVGCPRKDEAGAGAACSDTTALLAPVIVVSHATSVDPAPSPSCHLQRLMDWSPNFTLATTTLVPGDTRDTCTNP